MHFRVKCPQKIKQDFEFHYISMNKLKKYNKVLKRVAQKHDEVEEFINNIIDEICSQGKLSAEEVTYFLVGFLQFMFSC